jgi:hypothetical protein
LERTLQTPIDAEYRSSILVFLTVIRGREEREHIVVRCERKFESLHHNLMSTANEFKIILIEKCLDCIWSECESRTPDTLKIPIVIGTWIRRKQIANQTITWNIEREFEGSNVARMPHFAGQTAMNTENMIADYGGKRQISKNFDKLLP